MKKVEEYIYEGVPRQYTIREVMDNLTECQIIEIIEQAQKDAYNQALIDAGMLGKVELVLVKSGEHPIYEYRINWESLKMLMK